MLLFRGIDRLLGIKGKRGYGISIAAARGDKIETYCSGSGRYGQDFPVNPDMLFQAGSVSKPLFALTLLRYVDTGRIDLDADISGVLGDFVKKPPMTFPALLSHTAGYSVGGFMGYRADAPPLSLEDVIAGFESSKGFIRKRVGSELRLKHTPELIFKVDHSLEYGRHIDEIIETLEYSDDNTDGSDGNNE